MAFRSELLSNYVQGTNNIILLAPLAYWCPRSKQEYVVPCGFISDFASIPRVFWPLVGHPADHKWREQSVLHDYLCRSGIIPRKLADQIWYDTLRDAGMGYIMAQTLYLAVRIGSLTTNPDNYRAKNKGADYDIHL